MAKVYEVWADFRVGMGRVGSKKVERMALQMQKLHFKEFVDHFGEEPEMIDDDNDGCSIQYRFTGEQLAWSEENYGDFFFMDAEEVDE